MYADKDIGLKQAEDDRYSLRRRLVIVVLIAVTGVWSLLGITLYRVVLRASALEFDEQVQQLGRILLAYADHEYAETGAVIDAANEPPPPTGHAEVMYQIWSAEGALVYRSAGAPAEPLGPRFGRGFYDVRLATGDWRVYSLASHKNPLIVQVAESARHRTEMALRALAAVGVPILLALPLLGVLIYLVTSLALRPLSRIARQLRERHPQDLRPLGTEVLPDELHVLRGALNDLLLRQNQALERESRFTGDAAHELRTPLAAVRAQAQLAIKLFRNGNRTGLEAALDRLIAGADRASRLVTQLLALARLERPSESIEPARCRLAEIVRMVIHDLEHLAASRDVRIQTGELPQLDLPEDLVYLMLRNLVENALQHSSPQTQIHIDARAETALIRLIVTDRGPGLPPDLHSQVRQRFYRASHTYDGSGLGLSIVARAAEILGGSLELAAGPGGIGLAASVTVPTNPSRLA